jgi:predicted transcriptional regulator
MLSDRKKVYGIILDKKVKEEIDKVANNMERSSSWLINDILKKYLRTSPHK